MTKIIIGIHGLNKKPEPEVLWDGWKSSIDEGLRVNCKNLKNPTPFAGVFWDNEMRTERDPNPDRYRPAHEGAIKTYDEGFSDLLRQFGESLLGKTVDFFKRRYDVNDVADFALEKIDGLEDLSRYYEDSSVNKKLTEKLIQAVLDYKDKKILLIAHSMGSIVAYDALRNLGNLDAQIRIDHLVTIGSPLGLPHVRAKNMKKYSELRTPSCVRRWTNMADKRDPVAMDEHLADDYKANAAGVRVNDELVYNDWVVSEKKPGMHHKSYGYLRTPEISRLINEFI